MPLILIKLLALDLVLNCCVNSLLKRELHHLVSEHIIEIHAIEPSVFELSPHERIVIGVNGRDFHA